MKKGSRPFRSSLRLRVFHLQEVAVRPLTRAGPRAVKRNARLTQPHREFFEIAWVCGPTDQMWRGQLFEMSDLFLRERLDAVLFRIGGNNFQIAAIAKCEQSVTSASARMNTAKRGAYADSLCDKIYAAIQIGASE